MPMYRVTKTMHFGATIKADSPEDAAKKADLLYLDQWNFEDEDEVKVEPDDYEEDENLGVDKW